MSQLLLLTNALRPRPRCCRPRPALAPGPRRSRRRPSALVDAPPADAAARRRPARPAARRASLCRLLRTTGVDCPVLLVVTEGGLAP